MDGFTIGVIGLAICVILCGFGSVMGLTKTGSAAAGVLSDDPKRFSKVLVLVVLPATQGIYGFVFAIVGMGSLSASMSISAGLTLLGAALPLAVVGLLSGIFQGKSAQACIYAVAKKENLSGRLILFPAMVETYAILALVISILLL